ncbi:MAG: acyl-CoA dehydrogenase family protein [Emcibacter sp.]|nr:acyl-CoA dehydrogenase family protein [Emcibacter sp.]
MAALNEEQNMLKDAATSWVRGRAPVTELRKLRDSGSTLGYDPALYAEMAEMGWTGIIIPEEYDGVGFGYRGLGVILEELGKTLTASPLISSSLASVCALTLGGSSLQKETWLPKISDGSVIATVAVDESHRHAPLKTALSATPTGNSWTLNGIKMPVPEGMGANFLIVSARTSGKPGDRDGITLFLVKATTDGLTRTPMHQIDSRYPAKFIFDQVSVEGDAILGDVDEGADLLEQILDRACAGTAAEMLGTASQALETTLEYLKIREQFGQIIGSFQALQHRAVAMFGEIELTRTAVEAALDALDDNSDDIPQLVSLAKIMACETLKLVSNEMVQMHGGIGMTDEHDAGLYLKRARVVAASYGNAAYHRERYAQINGF